MKQYTLRSVCIRVYSFTCEYSFTRASIHIMLRSRASVNFKRLTERPHFIRSKRPTERPHLLAHKKRNLAGLERNAAALGTKGLNALVKSKIIIIIN